MVPTRELAIQVQREALKFSYNTPLRIRILYGGTSINRQREILRDGADLVVATAGSSLWPSGRMRSSGAVVAVCSE